MEHELLSVDITVVRLVQAGFRNEFMTWRTLVWGLGFKTMSSVNLRLTGRYMWKSGISKDAN